MSASFYMDVHIPQAITDQLRRKHVDVLTVIEDGRSEATDKELLERALGLDRLIVTQDIRFKALAQDWQRDEKSFAGLDFGHQLGATIGQYVDDLELIAKSSETGEWAGQVEHPAF